jgi:hypothetical protein
MGVSEPRCKLQCIFQHYRTSKDIKSALVEGIEPTNGMMSPSFWYLVKVVCLRSKCIRYVCHWIKIPSINRLCLLFSHHTHDPWHTFWSSFLVIWLLGASLLADQ